MNRAWTWRLIILIELLIFAGITKSCAQTAMRFEVDYTKIPVNSNDIPIQDTVKVLFVFEKDCIGIVTPYDTLALEYITRNGNFLVFIDVWHDDDQEYSLERFISNHRFLWIVVPMRPFSSRKVYNLILESL